jgi:hypothetical protein
MGETQTTTLPKASETMRAEAAVRRAKDVKDRQAVTEEMTADSGLGQIVKRYLAPRNSGEFWAIVAVLIAILPLAISTGQRAGNQTIYNICTKERTPRASSVSLRDACLSGSTPPKITKHPKVSGLRPWGAVVRSRC